MDLIKKIKINNPPTKYIKKVKHRKKGSTKKGNEDVYYLTANLFYSNNMHFSVRSEIVNSIKGFLMEYIKDVPKLSKMRMDITYSRKTDGFDLDNKIYFWQKILLDLFKTPTSKEIIKARKYNKEIKSLYVLKDDSCKYVTELNAKYIRGEHEIIIDIYGTIEESQKELF